MSEATEAPANVGELLNKLLHVKKTATGWTADCPCEGHSTPGGHLSVTDAGDKALVSCFNVHSYEQICAALGYRSLSYNREGHRAEVPRRMVKTYPYTDEQGHLLYETVRYDPKDFRQRRPDGKGGWLWNLESTRRVLYKLPQVLSAIARHEPIILCEGEKDADTVYERTGIVATTSPMGAGKWNGHDYEDALDRAYVVICGDTDKPGLAHVDQVARSLHGTAATVKILSLPTSVKDVTEWFEAEGTPDQFRSMIEQARVYVPEGLPIISVTDRHLREITSDALEALYHANDPPLVFRRSGVLTRVAVDERGRPQAEALSEAALRGRMARVANFVRINPKGSMVPVPPPLDVTRDVASLSDLAFFPKLTGITESPVLRNDGTILAEPGYDSATGLFYQPVSGFVLPPVPSSPTSSDIAEAAASSTGGLL